MERTLIRRGDYPSLFYTPFKWHLPCGGRWIVGDNGERIWYSRTSCNRYEIPDTRGEWAFIDHEAPGEEKHDHICKWCLRIVRELDSQGITDKQYEESCETGNDSPPRSHYHLRRHHSAVLAPGDSFPPSPH